MSWLTPTYDDRRRCLQLHPTCHEAWCCGLGLQKACRTCNQVSDLATDQSVQSIGVGNMCQRARDMCQSAAVPPPVNFIFDIAVFRRVENLGPLTHHTNCTEQNTGSARLTCHKATPGFMALWMELTRSTPSWRRMCQTASPGKLRLAIIDTFAIEYHIVHC